MKITVRTQTQHAYIGFQHFAVHALLDTQNKAVPIEFSGMDENHALSAPITKRGKILILTVSHGESHTRAGNALRKAFIALAPDLEVKTVDAIELSAPWFRVYYNSYLLPLKYCPSLWEWVEDIQHTSDSSGPRWLYQWGGKRLFRFIEAYCPDVVITTEVGLCEIVALYKRQAGGGFTLVASPTDSIIDRPWAQPEVDFYVVAPGDAVEILKNAGVPSAKIFTCGIPVDPSFGSLADRITSRARLHVKGNLPLLLVTFGGWGIGNPQRIVQEIKKVHRSFQTVFIAGKNHHLENKLRHLCNGNVHSRVLGWVDNIQEWMAAADLLIGKPGSGTVAEAVNTGLPILALAPLPGAERRNCGLLEKWKVGYWIKESAQLAPTITRLLSTPDELEQLRSSARFRGRPHAALDAAAAILELIEPDA